MKKLLLILLSIFGILSFMTSTVYAFSFTNDLNLLEDARVDWSIPLGSTDPNGNTNSLQDITAYATFAEVEWDSTATGNTTFEMTVNIYNTTTDLGNEVGIQKLAMGMTPAPVDVRFLDDDDGEFITASTSISSELKVGTGAQSSTGNGTPNTLQEGEHDIFNLLFEFDGDYRSIVFDPNWIKIQTESISLELAGSSTPVPEPATMLLLGVGLVGIAGVGRKKLFKK